jgi:hypothetical protein
MMRVRFSKMCILGRSIDKHPEAPLTPGMAVGVSAMVVKGSFMVKGSFADSALVIQTVIIKIRSQRHVVFARSLAGRSSQKEVIYGIAIVGWSE